MAVVAKNLGSRYGQSKRGDGQIHGGAGVLSGYQLLMKPVVFTEVKEAENMSQTRLA